jgi:hypothetical protein
MAIRHRRYMTCRGVQFHPESVLTEYGGKNDIELDQALTMKRIECMKMKETLQYLFDHRTLGKDNAKEHPSEHGQKGKYNDAEIAAFISVYLMRSITVEELGRLPGCIAGAVHAGGPVRLQYHRCLWNRRG